MKNKSIIIAVVILVFGLQGFPQIKKANRQYELFNYSKAIPFYEKAARSKNDQVRREATVKLADCYRLTSNVNEARSWYLKATEFKGIESVNYFYLGMAQRSLQKYDEAKKSFLEYARLAPNETKGLLYATFCDSIKPWLGLPPSAEIKNAGELNSEYSDFGPAFYKEGLVMVSDRQLNLLEKQPYYWTNRSYLDLYYSSPSYYQDYWSQMSAPASMSKQFNQTFHDGPATFINDSIIFVTRTTLQKVKKGDQGIPTHVLKIYSADLSQNKLNYLDFPFNSDAYSNGHPTLFSDGKTIIFVSDKPGGEGESDLYISTYQNNTWSQPESLGKTINSKGNDVFPLLVNDTLLYFASDGHLGYGGLDLFVSRLVKGEWSKPLNLKAPINSSYDDFAMAISHDLSSGFFSSNRPGGKGSDDIYAFRNAKTDIKQIPLPALLSVEPPMAITGFVKDKTTSQPIPGARVYVLNSKTNKVKVLETDPQGFYFTPAEKDQLYIVKASKPEYLDDCTNKRIAPSDTAKIQHLKDLMLDQLTVDKVFRIDNIYYDLDKWFIREDAKPELNNVVSILKRYPINIELASHTDSRASNAYNDELSQKRAESAVRYIVLQGVDPSRISAKGYGESKLVNRCADGVQCTEEEHQANRRTEFKITSIDKELPAEEELLPFETGDEVDLQLFPDDFFRNCLSKDKTP